jgi:hypothetical protein
MSDHTIATVLATCGHQVAIADLVTTHDPLHGSLIIAYCPLCRRCVAVYPLSDPPTAS